METVFMQQPYHIRAVSPGVPEPDMPLDPPYQPPQPGLPPTTVPGGPVSDPPLSPDPGGPITTIPAPVIL